MPKSDLEREKLLLERRKLEEEELKLHVNMLQTLLTLLMLIISISMTASQLASMANIAGTPWVDPDARMLLDQNQKITAYVFCRRHVLDWADRVWRVADGFVSKVDGFGRDDLARIPRDCKVWTYDRSDGEATVRLIPFSVSGARDRYIHPDMVHGYSRYTGAGVTVAIIDTGVDYMHPDLRDRIVMLVSFRVRDESGRPLVFRVGVNGTLEDAYATDRYIKQSVGEYAWLDENGHGTHVAGTIAGTGVASGGRYVGMAPGARLVIVKAFAPQGVADVDTILDALDWVSKQGFIDIVNLSFGTTKHESDDPVGLMAQRVYESGKIVVAAAGNFGQIPGSIVSPASNPYVIAVGGYDPYTGTVPMFSSMGAVDGYDKPDVVAVGVSVVSAFPTYDVAVSVARVDGYYAPLSGTSMATAVASGVLARWVEAVGRDRVHDLAFLAQHSSTLNPLVDKNWVAGYGVLESP